MRILIHGLSRRVRFLDARNFANRIDGADNLISCFKLDLVTLVGRGNSVRGFQDVLKSCQGQFSLAFDEIGEVGENGAAVLFLQFLDAPH